MLGWFGAAAGLVLIIESQYWEMGALFLLLSIGLVYFVYTHPRFDAWVEFGDRLRHRDFNREHDYEWSDVRHISAFRTSDSNDMTITLSDGTEITIDAPPERLPDVAEGLLPGLRSAEPDTRKRVILGLGHLSCVTCSDEADDYCPQGVAEMRNIVMTRLREASEDSDISVRNAAAAAVRKIQEKIWLEEHSEE